MAATETKRVLLVGGPGSVLGANLLARLSRGDTRTAATYFTEAAPPASVSHEKVSLYRLDITRPAEVEAVVERVTEELGAIDVLINNAAIFADSLLPLLKHEQWQQVLEVNLTGTFNTCKSVARRMMARKSGRIINIVSLKGVEGGAGESAYAASKAGVIALTKSLARELARANISVNAVCPGFISSPLNNFSAKIRAQEQERALLDISHNLADVVNFIEYLCDDNLKSVTGQIFHIDSRIH